MVKWCKFCSLGVLIAITGCSSVSSVKTEASNTDELNPVYPAMAVPLQPRVQNEVQIAKLSQLLHHPDINDELRAKVLYERGCYYDELGLRDLAKIDFSQSLKINPAQPEIFNLLGLYFTQIGEFDTAYQAFDSTLDLDPNNQQAVYNRAVALYYGGRTTLALEDMVAHYNQDPNDPFRVLWLSIMESELDQQVAIDNLRARSLNHNDDWGWVLVGIMLGDVSEEAAIQRVMESTQNNVVMAQRLTEAYFYLGKRYIAQGDTARALSVYKLAISLNVFDYVEHSYSFIELERIFKQYRAAQTTSTEQNFVHVRVN